MIPDGGNPLKYVEKIVGDKQCTFMLLPVSPDTVAEIISGLKSSCSSRLDNISAYVLKLVKSELVPAIMHIVNLSILYKKMSNPVEDFKGNTTPQKGGDISSKEL